MSGNDGSCEISVDGQSKSKKQRVSRSESPNLEQEAKQEVEDSDTEVSRSESPNLEQEAKQEVEDSDTQLNRPKSPKMGHKVDEEEDEDEEDEDEEGDGDGEEEEEDDDEEDEDEDRDGKEEDEDSEAELERAVREMQRRHIAPPPERSQVPREMAVAQTLRVSKKALSFWNETKKPEYELVRGVRSAGMLCVRGLIYHCNFEAKRKDDPQAPVELFFGQVFAKRERGKSTHYVLGEAEICERLGIGSSFPAREACTDCDKCMYIHHPKNRPFTGMKTDDDLEVDYLAHDAAVSETC